MAVVLITYDLNKESTRPPIVEYIRKLGNSVNLSESSYAVDCELSVKEIYSQLETLIDDNDQIYVIAFSGHWAGFGPDSTNNWLNNHL